MSNLIKPQQPSHWYRPDATPAYGATLREARKEGLYPSVTSISQVIAKPSIEAWRLNNLLEVAFEMAAWHEGTVDDFKEKVKAEWEKRTTAAAELGTKYHEAIECMLQGESPDDPAIDQETIEAVRRWCKDNRVVIGGIERCFAHPLGFGGRADLYGQWKGTRDFVLDWKTTDTRNKKKLFYPDFAIQLAANANGLELPEADLVSVVVSTTEPGVVVDKVWGNNELWYAQFLHRFMVWKYEKNYWPVEAGDE